MFIDLIAKEKATNPSSPVVIHCRYNSSIFLWVTYFSAGIGRSGTLIAIYNLDIVLREHVNNLDSGKLEPFMMKVLNILVRLSVFGVVRRLREQRWGMVNTSVSVLVREK